MRKRLEARLTRPSALRDRQAGRSVQMVNLDSTDTDFTNLHEFLEEDFLWIKSFIEKP
jgi:hypothetical protein